MKKIIKIVVISLSVLFISACSGRWQAPYTSEPSPKATDSSKLPISASSKTTPSAGMPEMVSEEIISQDTPIQKQSIQKVYIHIDKNSHSANHVNCAAYGYDNRCVAW